MVDGSNWRGRREGHAVVTIARLFPANDIITLLVLTDAEGLQSQSFCDSPAKTRQLAMASFQAVSSQIRRN